MSVQGAGGQQGSALDQTTAEPRADAETGALFHARQVAFDRGDCGNGPDEEGNWPCDPQVVFGDNWAVCSVCGREAAWPFDSSAPGTGASRQDILGG